MLGTNNSLAIGMLQGRHSVPQRRKLRLEVTQLIPDCWRSQNMNSGFFHNATGSSQNCNHRGLHPRRMPVRAALGPKSVVSSGAVAADGGPGDILTWELRPRSLQ